MQKQNTYILNCRTVQCSFRCYMFLYYSLKYWSKKRTCFIHNVSFKITRHRNNPNSVAKSGLDARRFPTIKNFKESSSLVQLCPLNSFLYYPLALDNTNLVKILID